MARIRSPIPFGEALALMGVIIAGLGLYVSFVQHTDNARERQVEEQQAHQRDLQRTVLVLRGDGTGGRIRLLPADPGQVLQSQDFYFPGAVRGGSEHLTGGGYVDAGWFAGGLKKALKGAADNGAEREMPVGVVSSYVQDGQVMTDASLYHLGYTVHRKLLGPADVRIEGIALVRRGLGADVQGAVDAAWSRANPPG